MNWAILALNLLQALLPTIRAIEEAIPGDKKGKEKAALVLNTIEQVTGNTTAPGLVKPVLDGVVAALNAAGGLKKSQ